MKRCLVIVLGVLVKREFDTKDGDTTLKIEDLKW